MKRFNQIFVVLFLALSLAGCSKTVEKKYDTTFPPNMAIYYQSVDTVWKALMRVVKIDLLYNLPIENRSDGYFITDWVTDDQAGLNFKYRINGTIKFEGRGVAVVLYREIQIRTQNGWTSEASDYSTEHFILGKLAEKLKGLPPYTPPAPKKRR